MSSLGDKLRRDVSNILVEILIWVAEVLFSKGSDAYSGQLCRLIIIISAFCKHDFPELSGTEQNFVTWKKIHLLG